MRKLAALLLLVLASNGCATYSVGSWGARLDHDNEDRLVVQAPFALAGADLSVRVDRGRDHDDAALFPAGTPVFPAGGEEREAAIRAASAAGVLGPGDEVQGVYSSKEADVILLADAEGQRCLALHAKETWKRSRAETVRETEHRWWRPVLISAALVPVGLGALVLDIATLPFSLAFLYGRLTMPRG